MLHYQMLLFLKSMPIHFSANVHNGIDFQTVSNLVVPNGEGIIGELMRIVGKMT